MKILFIEPYPTEGPSSRYRVEQYVPYFRKNGIRCIVRPFVSSRFYKILYKKGHYCQKGLYFIEGAIKRFFDIFTALECDIIFIHLEAFPFGPPLLELLLAGVGKKIIYDLDDAIFMGATSPINHFIKCLKCPSKIKQIIKISRHVITCNEYLGDYARRYNKNVTVIHTSVDTEKFIPRFNNSGNGITIGWIGSHSTAPYLDSLWDVFSRLAAEQRFTLKIIGAGEYARRITGVHIVYESWNLNTEINQFQSLDIGVYPLPSTEWILGKTGFKTIQYMSVGVPCVASNVGANSSIVHDGENGFLAINQEEWIQKLAKLIKDAQLRKCIGMAGRKTVEENFSVKANAPKYLDIIKKL